LTDTKLPDPLVPATRADAIARGDVRYATGVPCPHGHNGERYTLSGYCTECQLVATRRQKQAAKARREGR